MAKQANKAKASKAKAKASSKQTEDDSSHQSQARTAGLPYRIITQYMSDLSFENPGTELLVSRAVSGQPQRNVHWHIGNELFGDNEHVYKAETRVTLSSHFDKDGENIACYVLELAIVALVEFSPQLSDDEVRQQVLRIEVPRLVYPFLRHQVDNILRDGGYPALQLPSLDFVATYRQYKQSQA